MQSEFFSHSNPYTILFRTFRNSAAGHNSRSLAVRPWLPISFNICHWVLPQKHDFISQLISRDLKIKVMPILYIDCLDCKMTTLNAPLHLNAYNFSKRIYNLYLQVWWHQVKTGWLGEQARWSEFCVLIIYQVFYSLACSLCSPPPPGGGYSWEF